MYDLLTIPIRIDQINSNYLLSGVLIPLHSPSALSPVSIPPSVHSHGETSLAHPLARSLEWLRKQPCPLERFGFFGSAVVARSSQPAEHPVSSRPTQPAASQKPANCRICLSPFCKVALSAHTDTHTNSHARTQQEIVCARRRPHAIFSLARRTPVDRAAAAIVALLSRPPSPHNPAQLRLPAPDTSTTHRNNNIQPTWRNS